MWIIVVCMVLRVMERYHAHVQWLCCALLSTGFPPFCSEKPQGTFTSCCLLTHYAETTSLPNHPTHTHTHTLSLSLSSPSLFLQILIARSWIGGSILSFPPSFPPSHERQSTWSRGWSKSQHSCTLWSQHKATQSQYISTTEILLQW